MLAEESPNTAFSFRSARVFKIGEHYRNRRGKYTEFVAVEGFKYFKPNVGLDSETDRLMAKSRSRIIQVFLDL